KRHPGQADSARRARELLAPTAELPRGELLRAPLSSRYAPQVHGAARTALAAARAAVEAELGAGADNPVLPPDGGAISNSATTGGQELALALDMLATAVTSVAVASERRTAGLLDGRAGLPRFLRHRRARPGVDSGLMIAQYTAAALVAELRARGGAATVHSSPSCAGVEGHVSMSALAARQAARAVELAGHVLAIELLCACQAVDLAGRALPAPLAAAHRALRERVPTWVEDRLLADDVASVRAWIASGAPA